MNLFKPLKDSDIEQIRDGSLEILEKVGVRVEHEELLKLLCSAGARVEGATGRVFLPAALVKELIAQVPSSYTICLLDGSEVKVANDACHMLGNLLLPNTLDYATGRLRMPTLSDVRRHNALLQSMEEVKGIYRMEAPISEDRTGSQLLSLEMYAVNNVKHIFTFGTSEELMAHYLAFGRIISDYLSIPLERIISASCTVSTPLHLPPFYGEFLLRCCQEGFAVSGTISPNAGTSAPYNLAGTLLMGNAENLFVASVTQIVKPGNPFYYMFAPSITDMSTGRGIFYSMDKVLWRPALGQLARSYGFPFVIDGGGSMTSFCDVQAGMEGMAAMLAAYSIGPAWLGSAGILDNGMSSSPEMTLIHASACREVARFLERGIQVDGDRLDIDSIKRGISEGSFITNDLTLAMLHGDEFFQNPLFGYSDLRSGFRRTMMERAHERIAAVAAEFTSPLPGELQEELHRYFHNARMKGR